MKPNHEMVVYPHSGGPYVDESLIITPKHFAEPRVLPIDTRVITQNR
jgi:hypothetical protein